MEANHQKPYYVLGKVLLFYVCTLIIFAVMSGAVKHLPYADLLSMSASAVLTLLLTFLFLRTDRSALQAAGLVPDSNGVGRFIAGVAAGVVMVLLQAFIVSRFAAVTFEPVHTVPWKTIGLSLFLYLSVACREELVFRGYALNRLKGSIGARAALLVITVLFILEHVIAGSTWKMAVIGSGLGGLLFGVAAIKTSGLALSIGLHFSWNLMQWLLGFKNGTGVWHEVVEKGQEVSAENVALIGFSIVMILAIAGLLSISWKRATASHQGSTKIGPG